MARIIRHIRRPLQTLYDVAVGLGSCCQTAYQLFRLGLRGPAFPFDWLLLDFHSLYNILENKFKNFLNKEDLELRREHYVLDKRYGTRLLHDFKYKKEFVWLEDYQFHYDKYWRRINRFLGMTGSSEKVLFVRRECTKDQAVSLRNMIRRVYPGLAFGLLIVDETEEVKLPWGLEDIHNYFLIQKHPYEWHGIDSEWTKVMSNFLIPTVVNA